MIQVIDRRLKIPNRIIGYSGDNLVEVRTFELNRMYGDIDLAQFDFKLDTEIDGVKNIIDLDKSVTEDKITLTWTVRESHILHPGRMSFQIRAFSQGEEKWHSAVDYVIVQSSINATEAQPDPLPSEFVQMEQRVTAAKNQAQAAAETAEQQADRAQGIADTFENTTLPAAIQSVEQAVEEQIGIAKGHADRAQELADTFENETLPAAIQAVQDAGQEKVDEAAQQVDRVQGIIDEAEQEILPELRQAIEDGGLVKTALDGSIESAGTANTQLSGTISAAGTAKTGLEGTITQANIVKGQLDGSITQAGTKKTELDGSITAAGQVKEALDESIATGDLVAFRYDFESHLNDYATYKDSNNLKVAKVEKELNDYKATMQQVNINQEPKQKATGYGVISLPPNAANGQISVTLFGNTEVDEEGNTKSTVGAIRVKSVGKNLCPVNNVSNIDWGNSSAKAIFKNHIFYIDSGSYVFTAERDRGAVLRCHVFDDIDTLLSCRNGNSAFVKCRERIDLGGTASMSKKFLSKGYVLFGVFSSDASTVNATNIQLERGETATEYEPYKESNTYVIVKDEEGNILELRSLPNGTSDEINVTDRKLIKRIEEKSNIAKGMVIDFADMAEGGTYYAWNEDGETEAGVKGDTLGIDATELIYQLTIPVETPVQVSGSLVSYPSGTVYIEPFVADAGIYTNKMTVLHQDLPIKALEKLSKIDFMTGLETELDVSDAVIAEDKLSFTHPDLVDGDIVFYTYVYDKEGTEGETEIEYYDSRYVVKDSVTGKFYKWHITVANGVPSIELKEV